MFNPINTSFIKHPLNWVIVLLMLIIAGAFGHLVLSYFGVEPSRKDDTPTNGLTNN